MLMTVVFLWLGNVTMGQTIDCDDIESLNWQQKLFCDCNLEPELRDAVGGDMNYVQLKADWNWCCVSEAWENLFNNILPVCTASQMGEWNSCTYPEWSVSNWFICVCPDAGGIKQIAVDGVCKKCNADDVCCGVKLNTKVPFIGNCIESKKDYVGGNSETGVTWEEAFPVLMWSLTKILVTVILIVSFLLIVAGGIMIATGDPAGGKKMIIKVVIGIAILWASWVILRLINPNFFG